MFGRLLLAACAMSAGLVPCAFATEPFVGRWAVNAKVCPGQGDTAATAALVATSTSLWWFEGHCRIGKMYKARAFYIQVHCGGKDVPVTLDVQGDRMKVIWGGRTEELRRCG